MCGAAPRECWQVPWDAAGGSAHPPACSSCGQIILGKCQWAFTLLQFGVLPFSHKVWPQPSQPVFWSLLEQFPSAPSLWESQGKEGDDWNWENHSWILVGCSPYFLEHFIHTSILASISSVVTCLHVWFFHFKLCETDSPCLPSASITGSGHSVSTCLAIIWLSPGRRERLACSRPFFETLQHTPFS